MAVRRCSHDCLATLAGSAAPSHNPFRYTGTYQDSATGLYQMGHRYYQPGAGRFTQVDPLPQSQFWANRYEYVNSSPANYTEPTGLCPFCLVAVPLVFPTVGQILVAAAGAVAVTGAIVLAAKWIETWDGQWIEARPLDPKEVKRNGWERVKQDQGYSSTDTIWVDTKTGKTYIGNPDGSGEYVEFP